MSGRKRWTHLDQMVGEGLPPKASLLRKDRFDARHGADTVPGQGKAEHDGTGEARIQR